MSKITAKKLREEIKIHKELHELLGDLQVVLDGIADLLECYGLNYGMLNYIDGKNKGTVGVYGMVLRFSWVESDKINALKTKLKALKKAQKAKAKAKTKD